MANIKDVAERANVSKTLVSRVLNGKKGVSLEARQRIYKAIKELNYKSNVLARSLVLQQTKTIGIIIDQLCESFYYDLINEIQKTAEEMDYSVIFGNGRNNAQIKHRYVNFFTQGIVDGIIIYGSFHTDESVIKELADTNYPFVLIENEIQGLDVNNILVNNCDGTMKATSHLINLGYKDIMHFSGDINYKVSLDRLNGYVMAMQKHNLPIKDGMIVYTDFTEKSGYDNMKRILEKGRKPEAIFFGADITAFGAIRAIYEHGLKVPEDIAIVGFDDDIPKSRDIVFPALTTVRQPLKEIGRDSIKLLLKTIQEPERQKERHVFETELIIRDSCGAKK